MIRAMDPGYVDVNDDQQVNEDTIIESEEMVPSEIEEVEGSQYQEPLRPSEIPHKGGGYSFKEFPFKAVLSRIPFLKFNPCLEA